MVRSGGDPHDGHMHDTNTPVPPPPPPPPPPPQSPVPPASEHGGEVGGSGRIALHVVATGAGFGAAVVGGGLIGWLAAAVMANDCSPSDGWCELGAAIGGALLGLVVAVVAHLVTGVLIISRRRPAGRRAGPIAVHVAIPVVVAAGLALLGACMEAVG